MDARKIAEYAAAYSAGVIIEDQLLEMFDDKIVAVILAEATTITASASGVITDTMDTAFDAVESVTDIFDW